MSPFREFVDQNLPWFSGRLPETEASLSGAEQALGVRFPDDLRWLLVTHGYSYATGIDSLDGTVHDTCEGRRRLSLPPRYVILKNNGYETHAVLLDTTPDPSTGEHPVHFVDWQCMADAIGPDTLAFPSYLAYARQELENERRFISEEDIESGPSEYRLP